MKKFGVIHHSQNWIFDPWLPRFDTKEEAEKYVKDFRGSSAHSKDVAEIVEFHSIHESAPVDQTSSGALYGFKEVKK